MDPGDKTFDPAFPMFTLDVVGNILSRAANPGDVGDYLTEEMREFTGARMVLILQCRHEAGEGPHRVVSVNPARLQDLAESAEIARLAELSHDLERTTLWHHDGASGEAESILSGLGFALSIVVPLKVGTFTMGVMLLLGLPEGRHVSSVADALGMLSTIVALVMRNAFLYNEQESIIDERTRQLMESEGRYRVLFEQAAEPIVLVDRESGRFEEFNSRAHEVLGYTRGEFEALTLADVEAGGAHPRLMENVARILEEGGVFYETVHKTKEGQERNIAVGAGPLSFRGKDFLLCFWYDVTARRQAEEKERIATEHLRLSIEQMLEGYGLHEAIFDEQGRMVDYRFLEFNPEAQRIVGLSREEIVGKTALELFPNVANRGLMGRYETVMATGEPDRIDDFYYEGDNLDKALEITCFRLDEKHFVCVFHDITVRKRAEEERRKLEAQMQHAQKLESLGVLAGGIAHDFNNLLMGVLGYADMAMMDLPPESAARDSLEQIMIAAKRAADLAKQMLAYSGRGRFVVKAIDLSRLVEDMAHLLEVSISKKAVIKYNFERNLPPVEADATQLRQIVMNLITNASDALGEKSGIISISTGAMNCDRQYLSGTYIDEELPEGPYVYLEVSDTGCGMDEEQKRKVFDPFFTTKFTGRGLGLAAALGIVRGHHGAIKVYSELDRGSSFKVLFPASERLPERAEEESVEPEGWPAGGTILVVDDEETIRTLTRMMLERMGFKVLTAEDGREGVQVFEAHCDEIDLVLLDMTMPHMDGEEAFREIRRVKGDVPVILSSGYNEQEATNRFAGKGLAGFIQKPYQREELKSILATVLGHSKPG